MEPLDALQGRINSLLKAFSDKTTEIGQLRKSSAVLKDECEALRQQLKQAEDRLLALEISKALPDNASREQSRKRIDNVIAEIDKILTNLND